MGHDCRFQYLTLGCPVSTGVCTKRPKSHKILKLGSKFLNFSIHIFRSKSHKEILRFIHCWDTGVRVGRHRVVTSSTVEKTKRGRFLMVDMSHVYNWIRSKEGNEKLGNGPGSLYYVTIYVTLDFEILSCTYTHTHITYEYIHTSFYLF